MVLVVVGQEPLHVANVEPAADLLERWHVRSLVTFLARARGPLGDDGRTRAEHVVTIILETPDVEVAEVVVGDVLAGVRNLVVRVGQVADQVAAEPANLAAQRRESLVRALR